MTNMTTPTRLTYGQRYRKKFPLKMSAVGKVWKALEKGRLIKQPCQICNAPKADAHHSDYGKALDVMWLCSKHHRAWHRVFIPEHPEFFNISPKAILNEEQVIEIKRGLMSGERVCDLAQRYKVNRNTIDSIKRNKSWRYVQP